MNLAYLIFVPACIFLVVLIVILALIAEIKEHNNGE